MGNAARRPMIIKRRGPDMRQSDNAERAHSWVVDYSAARAKAIEWLGDRYLLAKPINRSSAASRAKGGQRPAPASDRL
jgi:hypothetical protein